uniref:Uncharacterized protein n=1 Tax=Anguilla anguilla TaxID=7936 RepID=A0A0E9PW44_ANGAN
MTNRDQPAVSVICVFFQEAFSSGLL